jgi:hypothetical protein
VPGSDILTQIELLFPAQLSVPGKERLSKALTPFRPSPPPASEDYYLEQPPPIFLQGDIIQSLRIPIWNEHTGSYDKKYATGMMLSNTCDVELEDKDRNIPKQVMFAPAINASTYFEELRNHYPAAAKSIEHSIKSHFVTTRLYIPTPPNKGDKYPDGFVIELDKLFWFPINELAQNKDAYLGVRIASLSSWAHYLLLTKLALHICRTPEAPDRPAFS